MRKAILYFVLACRLVFPASAAIYYVDSGTGNDSDDGLSPANAWQSFNGSISNLSSGDTLYCTGSWNITNLNSWATSSITIEALGSATITLKSISINGTLDFNGNSVAIRGFTILSTNTPSGGSEGLIRFDGDNSILDGCVVRDIPAQNTDDEIVMYVTGDGNVVTNTQFLNITDRDIFRVWGIGNKWISCTFSNCTNPSAGTGGDPHADIFQTWWTGAAVWSNVVERCYFVNSSQATFQLKGTPDNINCHPGEEGFWSIRNNIFNNCDAWPVISTDNFRFYNNLIYESGTGQFPLFIVADTCMYRARFWNNVLINSYCQTGSASTNDYNAYYPGDADLNGANDFFVTEAECEFVDAAGGDFRIGATSVLRGAGYNLSSDPSMSADDYDGESRPVSGDWDAGPFQYQSDCTDLPDITSSLTVYGTNEVAFSYQITVDCAATNFASGTLPTGLTLDADTGLISGTPNVASPPTTNVVEICATNSFGGSCTNVTFIIYATQPVISITPESLAFGEQLENTSADLYFYVTNSGGGTLSGDVSTSAPWSIVGSSSYSLSSGQGTSFLVRFSPTTKGAYAGTVEFDGSPGSTNNVSGYSYPLLTHQANVTNALLYLPFQITSDYVHQTNDTPWGSGGRAVFGFVTTNASIVTVRGNVYAPNTARDSFFIGINTEPTSPHNVWDIIPLATNTPSFDSRWVNLRGSGTSDNPEFPTNQFSLAAGTNKLILLGREPDTRINLMNLTIVSEGSASGSGKGRGQKGTGGRGRRR